MSFFVGWWLQEKSGYTWNPGSLISFFSAPGACGDHQTLATSFLCEMLLHHGLTVWCQSAFLLEPQPASQSYLSSS